MLSTHAALLVIFQQPVPVAERARLLESVPEPLRFSDPVWTSRTLMLESQEYPSVYIRFAYTLPRLPSSLVR